MTKREVASSAYHIDVNGQDITVTVDNIKDVAVHPYNLADKISIMLDTELNSNAAAMNTVTASMSNDNGTGAKTVDLGSASVYSATMKFRNVGIDGNDISGAEFALYKYKTMTSAGGVQYKKYVKILDGIKGNPSCTIAGLNGGKYKLVQTVVPAGYKKMGSYEFTINMSGSGGIINSLSVTDDSGTAMLSPVAGESWSANLGSGIITSVIGHEADEKQTKEISAEVKYSYGGTVKDTYTKQLKGSVQVLEKDGKISTAGVSNIYESGYKLDKITLNGETVDSLPAYVNDGDIIVYSYKEDVSRTKMISATLEYYKSGMRVAQSQYRKSVSYFENMLDTNEIDDKSQEQQFDGYKIDKITVNGDEVESLPNQVLENSKICFYYVVDDNKTKLLTAQVQHILLDWDTKAESLQDGDSFSYRKEVRIVDSNYIDAKDIPVMEYKGYKVAYYYIGTSKYSVSDWEKAKVLNGSEVKIYYMVDISKTETWSAKIQYTLGDEVREEKTIQETAPVAFFESGKIRLNTDGVYEKTYKGWKLDCITINGEEKESLPTFLQDNDIVSYHYLPLSSNVIVRYVDENGDEIVKSTTIKGTYGQPYQVRQRNIDGYDFVSVSGKENGEFSEEDTIVTYHYDRKQTPITVKYIDEDDGREIAGYGYSSIVYYGETYETVAKDILGYELSGNNGKTSGEYGTEPIEVIYYYTKTPVKVTVKHVFEDKPELDRTEVISKKPGETYKTESLDIPGYICTSVSGMAEGIVSEDMTVIYYYEAVETEVTVQYVDEEGTLIDSPVTLRGKYGESYETIQREIEGYTFVSSTGNISGTFGLSNIEVIYSYKESLTTLIIKYVDEDGNEISDHDEKSYSFYSNYTVSPKGITGYDYKKIADTSAPVKGTMTSTSVTVVFVYQPKDVAITVKHVDESGKEIATKETITREYKESYTTSPKVIEGYVLTEIPDNASGQTSSEDFTVTYVYAVDSSNIKTLSAKVRYSLAGKLQEEDEETITKTVQILSEDTTLSTDSIHEKAYEGWVIDYITINDEERFNTLPETVEDKDVVVFVYRKVAASVTVQYVDENGREIKAANTLTGKYGDTYQTEEEDIEGYDLISDSGNTAGEMKGNITVVYTYRLKDMSVSVKYVDEDGKEIADFKEITGKYGESYTDSAIDIKGYILTSDRNVNGTFGDGKNEIVYTYKKEVLSITIRYIDEAGNDIAEEDRENKEIGQNYETSAKDIAGYILKETPENAAGVMDDENITVTYVYEAKIITITVKYLDENGKEIAGSETTIITSGDGYETHAGEFEGYDLVSDSGNTTGVAAGSSITVTYIYRQQEASITVKYVDGSDKEIAASDIKTGKYGDKYKTEAKEISGYDLVSGSSNTEGTMKGSITVTYTYKLQAASVTIKYVDDKTNKEISDREVLNGHMFDKYETVAKDISGYTLLKTPANAKGVMTEKNTIVIYRYVADEETAKVEESLVIVQYVDEDGNKITSSVIMSGNVGDTYETAPKKIDGYELLSAADNASGAIDKFTTIVTYVYRKADGDNHEPEKPAEGGVITVTGCPADLLSIQVYNYNPFPIRFNGKTYATGALIAVIPVNADGTATLEGLPYGTYRVKEYKTTIGFSANKNYYTVTVEDSNGSDDDNINPTPAQTGNIKLTGANDISLNGMEFKLRNVGGSSIIYNGNIINVGDDVGTFTAEDVYLIIDKLPYGIYELVQTGCTKGYHSDPSVYTINIVNETPVEITIQVSKHEHIWNEGHIAAAPTCTETGLYTYTCTVCDAQMSEVIGSLGHEYYTKEPTCQEDGYRECTRCGIRENIPKTEHNWDDGILTTSGTSCETSAVRVYTCRYCGEQKTVSIPEVDSHSYETSITKAGIGKDGHILKVCTKCGKEQEDLVIAGISHMELSYSNASYTGSALKPSATVYDINGKKISSSYYNAAYSNNVKVGTAAVKVTFKGNYSGVITENFTISPRGTSILSFTSLSKGFTVKWAIQDREVTGYELEYAEEEDFSDGQVLQITKYTTLAKTVTGLKSNTKYYIRIRTYKGDSYSGWSAARTTVTKE